MPSGQQVGAQLLEDSQLAASAHVAERGIKASPPPEECDCGYRSSLTTCQSNEADPSFNYSAKFVVRLQFMHFSVQNCVARSSPRAPLFVCMKIIVLGCGTSSSDSYVRCQLTRDYRYIVCNVLVDCSKRAWTTCERCCLRSEVERAVQGILDPRRCTTAEIQAGLYRQYRFHTC